MFAKPEVLPCVICLCPQVKTKFIVCVYWKSGQRARLWFPHAVYLLFCCFNLVEDFQNDGFPEEKCLLGFAKKIQID